MGTVRVAGFSRTPAPIYLGNHSDAVRLKRSLKGPHYIYDCRRTNIIGSLVQNASPFLFPCTIEYSLICAAILYVMWKNISNVYSTNTNTESTSKLPSLPQYKKAPHHYSVDCAQAHKGLFLGILFLVLTIISLILFFVLVSKPDLIAFAVMEVNICELSLYALSTMASIVGMIQVGCFSAIVIIKYHFPVNIRMTGGSTKSLGKLPISVRTLESAPKYRLIAENP